MMDDAEIIEDAEVMEDEEEVGTDLDLLAEEEEPEASLAERQQEVSDELAETARTLAALAQEAADLAKAPADTSGGGALVPVTQSASVAKKRLASLRAGAARQQVVIEKKQAEIKTQQARMESLMRQQMALAEEAMKPLEKFIARLSEGIWMVNLYLGRQEEIVVLGDGEAAPADMPVTIRQMVLAMDQECAVAPEYDGIDATNIKAFDKWLQADPAHLAQVLPEEKGVVALRPRFDDKDYGDPWKNAAVSELNKQTYFLIRNGEKVYRTMTEFKVGQRLVPTANEFASYFYEERLTGFGKPKHRIPILPGTPAWERAEEASDARQRHYMRVGLILQGLVDRTTVFHPLPESGINFLDFEHSDKTWKFLLDAEMSLGSGRQPFNKWLSEKNSQLQVGMRVVGSFRRSYSRDYDPWDGRIRPKGADLPPSGELLTIEAEEHGGYVVRYERQGEVYDPRMWVETRPGWGYRGGYRKPKQRASAVLDPSELNLLPFDLVTVEEMQMYLGARLDRHNYAHMFPLLKQAIKAKHAEREEEEPFRVMLAGVLARDNGVEVSEAEQALDELIEWFKVTNKKHRPLVGSEKEQAKAVRLLVGEHARRIAAAKKGARSEVVEAILSELPDALLIGRKRDGKYVVLTPENDENVWVREHEFSARGVLLTDQPWKLMPSKARRARWLIAYEAERFADWKFDAKIEQEIRQPEFEALTARVLADLRNGGDDEEREGEREAQVLAVAYDPREHEFMAWTFVADAIIDDRLPLTGESKEVGVSYEERKWWRKGTAAPSLTRSYRGYTSHYRDQRKPWDTRPLPGRPTSAFASGSDKVHENRYVVLYVDEMLDRHVEAERTRWAEFEKLRSSMRGEVNALLDSIVSAWEARNEAKLYADFLEEYLDPELWEGHRKAMKAERFAYPHKHARESRSFSTKRDALRSLVESAVERGIVLNGLTVWEAATEHFPPLSWFGEPGSWRSFVAGQEESVTRYEQFPEAIDLPEDIRHLTFKLPEPEEGDLLNVPDEDDWEEE